MAAHDQPGARPPGALGVRANLGQLSLQVFQVLLVGLTVGSVRTALPALAEREFALPARSPALLASIVVAFGLVKACMNFGAGALSERIGRRRVLALGWAAALPVPFLLRWGPTWDWIVVAAALLGVNQGLTWSMTLTSKLDLTRPGQRGLANGVNEFAGYAGVAVAGALTAWLAAAHGARTSLFWFTLIVVGAGLATSVTLVRETRPRDSAPSPALDSPRFRLRDRRMIALCQAGAVEKFVDALVWLGVPTLLVLRGASVARVGAIAGAYAITWGGAQLVTGPLSDRAGRRPLIGAGMLLCAAGVAIIADGETDGRWLMGAIVAGVGMAALYPTLGASVSDLAPAHARGLALGVYRFWRDLGYAAGALAIGLCARALSWEAAFWMVSAAVAASTLVYLALGAETSPARAARRGPA